MRPPCRPAERSPSTVGRGALPQAPVEWGRRREAPTPGRLTRRAARAFPPPPPCSYGCVGSGLAGGGGRCGRPGLGGAVEGRWRGAHGEGDGGGRERPAPRRSALYSGGGGGGVRALGGRRYVAVRVGMWVVTWLSLFFHRSRLTGVSAATVGVPEGRAPGVGGGRPPACASTAGGAPAVPTRGRTRTAAQPAVVTPTARVDAEGGEAAVRQGSQVAGGGGPPPPRSPSASHFGASTPETPPLGPALRPSRLRRHPSSPPACSPPPPPPPPTVR